MKRVTYLAAGCFWGMEHYLNSKEGVIKTSVGFMGGDNSLGQYESVVRGDTGHAEVVEVKFDDSVISFEDLVTFFFRIHDPTTLNRQHNDIGTQYRSTIFSSDIDEINTIKRVIAKLDEANEFSSKIVTTIEPVDEYHLASEPHQAYLKKNPNGYNCHMLRPEFRV